LLLHEKNIGAMANQMAVFSACTGKYVAMCEGDDYWTDPLKLQKQVDHLEANPEIVVSFTDYSIVDNKGILIKESKLVPEAKRHLNQEDLIIRHGIQILTAVFRGEPLRNNPNTKYINGDIALFAYLANFGEAGYLDIISGCYRISERGVYSSKEDGCKILIRRGMYMNLLNYKLTTNPIALQQQIQNLNFGLFNHYFNNGNVLRSLNVLASGVIFDLRHLRLFFITRFFKRLKRKILNITGPRQAMKILTFLGFIELVSV